jgi:hypothetical protein
MGVGPDRDALYLGLTVDLGHEQVLPVVRAGDVPRSQLRRQAVAVVVEQERRVIADCLEVPEVVALIEGRLGLHGVTSYAVSRLCHRASAGRG